MMNREQAIIQADSVVLVSGGARGITARCVLALAEQVHCKFILLGRSRAELPALAFDPSGCDDAELKRRVAGELSARGEKPIPIRIQKLFGSIRTSQEIQDTLAAITRAGGRAEYLPVDVADPALAQQLAGPVSRLGAVTGVIHGAGALVDKLIEKKTEADFETVYTPKVTGLSNLLGAVDMARLNFLVLFSSIVGFSGNAGQADYAIANEILNKSAYQLQRQYPECRVLSINWGPWDAGMVTPELKKLFEERHVTVIPSAAGAQMLVDALLHPGSASRAVDPVQVVVGGVPLLPAAAVSSDLRKHVIQRRLVADENPFLYDHMIGGHPVLPATCAAAWAAYSCEQLYPGFHFFSLKDYRVLKGIVFDDGLAALHTLDLQEVEKDSQHIVFDVLIWSAGLPATGALPSAKAAADAPARRVYHYRLRVTLRSDVPEAPVWPVESLQDSEGAVSGVALYENGTLFHGPAFQGVQRVLHLSRGKLVMRVELPRLTERIQGQFPAYTANPFIYDAIVQCVLIWAQYFYDAPCLPSSLRGLEQYRSIPFGAPCIVTMQVESQSETAVVGNILVQDEDGQAYMHLDGLQGTISPLLKRLFGKKD